MVDDNAVCFRHDDRRAAVGCQRCDKPICSSCMTSASVGFHCPDCTKSGAQKVYRGRDLLAPPTWVYGVIGLCVAVFVAQFVTGEGSVRSGEVFTRGMLRGNEVRDGEYWRIVTSGFLHTGVMHLAFNLYAMFSFAPKLERAIGRVRTTLVYAGGLFGGSALVLLFNFPFRTAGASGAVLGLAGGLVALNWLRGASILDPSYQTLLLLNLALPLITPISFWGHLGGLLGGFLVTVALIRLGPGRTEVRGPLTWGSPAAIAAVGLIVSFILLGVVGAQLGLAPIL